MVWYRSISRLAFLLVAAGVAGCGGCQGEKELAPPAPVRGQLPPVERQPAAGQELRDRTPHVICGVLVFAEDEDGTAPFEAQLSAEGDCAEGEAVYAWNFGDGSPPASGNAVTHTFEKPGTYLVKVQISSATRPDLKDSDELEIVVHPKK